MLELKRVAGRLRVNRSAIIYTCGLAILLALLITRLASQTPGMGPDEASTLSAAKLSHVMSNPLQAPYKLTESLLFHIGSHHLFMTRLTSVIFSTALLLAFFYSLRVWFGKPVSALATALLAFTPLYLLASRTATPLILEASSIALIFSYSLVIRMPDRLGPWLGFAIVTGLVLYSPGMVWLVLLGLLAVVRKLAELPAKNSTRTNVLAGLLLIATLLPLIAALVSHPQLIRQWLLIPSVLPSLSDFLRNLVWSLAGLFVGFRHSQPLNPTRLPLLDVAQIGMLIFGGYVMWDRLRSQFYWLTSAILLVCVLAALNDNYQLIMMALPAVAIFCAMGLRYLYIEWRRVFPYNPLANGFAILLMLAVILIHVLFGIRYSLLVWPAAAPTKHSYVLKY